MKFEKLLRFLNIKLIHFFKTQPRLAVLLAFYFVISSIYFSFHSEFFKFFLIIFSLISTVACFFIEIDKKPKYILEYPFYYLGQILRYVFYVSLILMIIANLITALMLLIKLF
ncbi:hypothetical protein [Campylobacter hyointestinalis]|uniref:hypothetical protein n=1 Tax=Campylobacter hyointestinalis TaxID=198 RepID=UPI000DCEEE09|nr:hypothetical protein [Campylobacter hyointestinalis]RAZ51763.1 hypothetical protein CHL10075_05630 [Campylobacter hyointestinalis subsp. lawsonii]RAZ60383.1 hypothetical protein CHL10071_06555 [Campylobacter hyointestinalis subsp. lawsonii]